MDELSVILILFPTAALAFGGWSLLRLCSTKDWYLHAVTRALMTSRIHVLVAIPLNIGLLLALGWAVLVFQSEPREIKRVSEYLAGLAPSAQLAPICITWCAAVAHSAIVVFSSPAGRPKNALGWLMVILPAGVFLPYLYLGVVLLLPILDT